jgi:hypothetical protein
LKEKTMKKAFLFTIILLLLGGCTQIDYVGKEYSPTDNVDIYFNEKDIGRDYTVMGQVLATSDYYFVSAEKMQKKIIEQAKKKGADGVIITELVRYQSGESSTYEEQTKTEEKEGETKSTITATKRTSPEETKEVRAIFIKYK